MPILEDVYNELINDEKTKKLGIKLRPFVKGSLSYLNNYTNVEIKKIPKEVIRVLHKKYGVNPKYLE